MNEPTWGPRDFESLRRIPLAIRERVWGGEGSIPAATASQRPETPVVTLLAAQLRLRAAERPQGAVYGDRRADRIGNRTVRIVPDETAGVVPDQRLIDALRRVARRTA